MFLSDAPATFPLKPWILTAFPPPPPSQPPRLLQRAKLSEVNGDQDSEGEEGRRAPDRTKRTEGTCMGRPHWLGERAEFSSVYPGL